MSTNGYTNCTDGTFYGFTDTENNEFYPGESWTLQWGAILNGSLPLNISLGRIGGGLVDPIVTDATFSKDSSLYQLIYNATANCTLEQYTWAIPSDFNTSNPQYQIGLFDGGAIRGDDDNGWRAWSPLFYVRDKSDAISASQTASATGLVTGTGQASATATATATATSATTNTSPSSTSSTSSTSNHKSSNPTAIGVGVGVGVGVGAAALIMAFIAFWYWRRRQRRGVALASDDPHPIGSTELQARHLVELPVNEVATRKVEKFRDSASVSQSGITTTNSEVHEME
ncbi:uncharacterized protein N7483_011929 [Penicillium malachiteum]|uniref:uncharacterized protein n=1 Tax=Penicillium malachiteum TaxID=1324776 RepID=UPI0025498D7C|nr:uncharacterized protein N7483_011929 [Penicillium malachiteum]KAJ5714748.1 hypothetical protein N7483_011929 [Penicillium malachiteum]